MHILIVALISTLLLPSSLKAELPPGAYAQLKRQAREVFQLRIESVQEIGEPAADTREYLCEAKVLVVERSLTGVKDGDSIHFRTYSVRPEAWAQGFVGPKSPAPPVKGWLGRVYLEQRSVLDESLQVAAYGESFVRLAKSPVPPDVVGYQLFVTAWPAALYEGERVVGQIPYGSESTVEQATRTHYLISTKWAEGAAKRAWVRRADVLIQPAFMDRDAEFLRELKGLETKQLPVTGGLSDLEAIRSAERAMVLYEVLYGEGHPLHTAAMRDAAFVSSVSASLSNSTTKEAKLQQAALRNTTTKQYCHAIKMSSRVVGLDHPIVLNSLLELGEHLERNGDHKSAEKVFRNCVERATPALGTGNRITWYASMRLGTVLNESAKYKDAERLYRSLLVSRLAVAGASDPHTLLAMEGLARAYIGLGNHAEAEALLVGALKVALSDTEGDADDAKRLCASLKTLYSATNDSAKLKLLAGDNLKISDLESLRALPNKSMP